MTDSYQYVTTVTNGPPNPCIRGKTSSIASLLIVLGSRSLVGISQSWTTFSRDRSFWVAFVKLSDRFSKLSLLGLH